MFSPSDLSFAEAVQWFMTVELEYIASDTSHPVKTMYFPKGTILNNH